MSSVNALAANDEGCSTTIGRRRDAKIGRISRHYSGTYVRKYGALKTYLLKSFSIGKECIAVGTLMLILPMSLKRLSRPQNQITSLTAPSMLLVPCMLVESLYGAEISATDVACLVIFVAPKVLLEVFSTIVIPLAIVAKEGCLPCVHVGRLDL